MMNSGFVAGTLVHTDKGLVPIQDIKVGDRVLSRSESSGQEAPSEYKPVTKAFCSGKGEIVRLTYCKDEDFEVANADTHVIFITRNHPVWVESVNRWIPIINLEPGVGISNFEGQKDLTVLSIETVFGIKKNNKLYATCAHPTYGNDDSDEVDMFIHFDKISYVAELHDSEFKYVDIAYDNLDTEFKDIAFEAFCNSRTVSIPTYNLEVKDYHTYFVGNKGLWVHDINNNDKK